MHQNNSHCKEKVSTTVPLCNCNTKFTFLLQNSEFRCIIFNTIQINTNKLNKIKKCRSIILIHLSTMRVVAEVPSIEIATMCLRMSSGTSSSRENSVSFHERTQSCDSPLFLDNTNKNLRINNYINLRFTC